MNSFLKITVSALSLTFSICLSSCEKDALLPPTTPDAKPVNTFSDVATQDISIMMPKKYTLIKMGDYELSYRADGKLAKVQKGDNYTTYEYQTDPAGKIIAYSWRPIKNGNGFEIYKKHVIELFYNSDVAARSEIWGKLHNAVDYYKLKTIDYTYDNQHRLVKCEDKDFHKNTLFAYNNEGDLTSMTVRNYETVVYTDLYTYTGNGPQQKDYHPQNPQNPLYSYFSNEGYDEGTELLFMPAFGKFNKHLVKNISRIQNAPYKVLFNYAYKYDLNADGHVTERECWNQTINLPVATELYQYKVENLAIQPQ